MNWLRQIVFRLQSLFWKKKIEAELSDELRTHLEMATEANIAAGMSPAEARHAAQRQFGGIEQIKESYRDQRGISWIEEVLQDLRFAVRSLRKSPGFTAVAVLSLAVAISLNATVFSLISDLVLRPLIPLRPGEVVQLFTINQPPRLWRPFSHAEYLILRDAKDTFADVAATYPTVVGIVDDDVIHRHFGYFTSENYFSMLGGKVILGRYINAAECRPNANIPVVVTSYAYWQSQGGRSDFVGSTLHINGQPYTVIGIAADDFNGFSAAYEPDFWAPLGVFTQFNSVFNQNSKDLAQQKSYTLHLTARLASGVTVESLRTRLPALAQRITAVQAADDAKVRTLHAQASGSAETRHFPGDTGSNIFFALGLFSLSGCVLLIASINLGNMLLARGTERAKEIALRLALGATRWRVIRQLLTEGLLIGCAGGAVGFLLSLWANAILIQYWVIFLGPMGSSPALKLRPGAFVLSVTFLCCLAATFLSSLVPALKVSRVDLVHDLSQPGGQVATRGHLNRFFAPRHLFLMTQIALSFAVLFIAGLFVRGALKAYGNPLGFDPEGCVIAEVDYSVANTPPEEMRRSLFAAIDRIRAQPGVQFVAAATQVPYGTNFSVSHVQSAAQTGKAGAKDPVIATYTATTPGFLDALGVRLLRGRDFTDAEARDSSAPRVAIVDESLAGKLFPTGDALGQRIRDTDRPIDDSRAEMEIVGICATHRYDVALGISVQQKEPDCFYVPYASASSNATQGKSSFLAIRYRTSDPSVTVAAIDPLRAVLRALDPEVPLMQVAPFATLIKNNGHLSELRMAAVALGTFGLIALMLAVMGVYGVKAYTITRRTREIGIRMALGAQRVDVLSLILKEGALQVMVGLSIGLLLAFAAGQLLRTVIYQVGPTDPVALSCAALLLAVSALLACWIPARRAARVDPMVALRCE